MVSNLYSKKLKKLKPLQDEANIEESQNHYNGVSTELFTKIKDLLDKKNNKNLKKNLEELHSADIADLLEHLNSENRYNLLSLLKRPFDPTILSSLSGDVIADVVNLLDPEIVAKAISKLDVDDVVHLIENLNESKKNTVLKTISKKDRILIEQSLKYPKDSAGRLMQRKIVYVPIVFNVGQALKHIYSNSPELPEKFYHIYVIDENHHPVGDIGLSRLIRCNPEKPVKEVMNEDLYKIPVYLDQEEIAQLFQHYGLISTPVIDENHKMVGRITIDDIVNVIKEEAEEDILKLARVGEADFYADTIETFYRRSPWLLVTLINTLVTIFVIGQFETSIESVTEIAFFLPVAAMMGGNSGLQVVTIIVRALTTNELKKGNILRAVRKEVFVGIINGIVFAFLLGATAGIMQTSPLLGVVVAGALICNMVWAAFIGCILPIIINRLGADPAIGAGPMLTIMTDVSGYSIYLLLATILLL